MRALLLGALLVACSTTEPPTQVAPSTAPTLAPTTSAAVRVPVEAAPLGAIGPEGLSAQRVAAQLTTVVAIFGGAIHLSLNDGKNWERSEPPWREGEVPLAVGVDPLSTARFVGTSAGRIFRRDNWYGTQWREVFAAPADTFQPAVQSFVFSDHVTYASLKGVLASEDDLPWVDITRGLGGLPDPIEARGRFGTGRAVPLADRVLVYIGGVMPEITGLWSKMTGGSWTPLTAYPGGEPLAMSAIDDVVVAVGGPGLDQSGRPRPATWLSPDRGATWRGLTDPNADQLLDVVPTPLGFVALGTSALYWLAPNDQWRRLAPVQGGTSLAANGREVFVAAPQGVLRFRIQSSAPPGTERCGYEFLGFSAQRNDAARQCLLRAFGAGRPAQLIVNRYTTEGAPITDTITVLGPGSIEVLTDDRDGFGRPGFFTASCTGLGPMARTSSGIEVTGCTGRRSAFGFP